MCVMIPTRTTFACKLSDSVAQLLILIFLADHTALMLRKTVVPMLVAWVVIRPLNGALLTLASNPAMQLPSLPDIVKYIHLYDVQCERK